MSEDELQELVKTVAEAHAGPVRGRNPGEDLDAIPAVRERNIGQVKAL